MDRNLAAAAAHLVHIAAPLLLFVLTRLLLQKRRLTGGLPFAIHWPM